MAPLDNLSQFREPDKEKSRWKKLMEEAQKLEPTIYAAFLQSIERLRNDPNIDDRMWAALRNAIAETANRTAGAEVLRVNVKLAFDATDEEAQRIVTSAAASLVKEVDATTREGIAAAVRYGVQTGSGTAEIARRIRPLIGLTERQVTAVENYRKALQSNPADALSRALRDRRFDRKLTANRPLSQAEVDKMVDAYTRRYLNYRASTIARTEAITALEAGRYAGWMQMLANNEVDGDVFKEWYVAHDERVCPICAPIPSMNEGGVAFNSLFDTPIGQVPHGPMHPDCRCVVFYTVR